MKNYEDSNINIISFILLIVGIILIITSCYLFFVYDPAPDGVSLMDSVRALFSFGMVGATLVLKHYIFPLILMVSGLIITIAGSLMLTIISLKIKLEDHDELEEKDNYIFQGLMITASLIFLMFFIYLLVSIIRLFMI